MKISKLKNKLYSNEIFRWINKRIAEVHFEDDFSFERFMDKRFPYLPTVPYNKQKSERRYGLSKYYRRLLDVIY